MTHNPEYDKFLEKLYYKTGMGNWSGFQLNLNQIFEASKKWKEACLGHDKLWLCWNVDPEWCLVQQKLVKEMGWTPLVGSDPRAKPPILVDGAIYVDFNASFSLPVLHMILVVEFAFLFIESKLAFWHSDLLVKRSKLEIVTNIFNSLSDHDCFATIPGRSLKDKILNQKKRYWELLACTTKEVSLHQFLSGSGWMASIIFHPLAPDDTFEKSRRAKIYYDHGSGVLYWSKFYKPESWKILSIKENYIDEGHFSRIRSKNYKRVSQDLSIRDLTKELSGNYDLHEACKQLSLEDLLINKS